MPCTCKDDGLMCPECEAAHIQGYVDLANAEMERQRREYEAGIWRCALCGDEGPADGDCPNPRCRDYYQREAFLAWVKPDAWREDEPAGTCPGHEWGEPEIEADGGDVDARRVCKLCGRTERQRLVSEPEAPNCYVPGEGWRVI